MDTYYIHTNRDGFNPSGTFEVWRHGRSGRQYLGGAHTSAEDALAWFVEERIGPNPTTLYKVYVEGMKPFLQKFGPENEESV